MKRGHSNKTELKKLTIARLQPAMLHAITGGSSRPTIPPNVYPFEENICYQVH